MRVVFADSSMFVTANGTSRSTALGLTVHAPLQAKLQLLEAIPDVPSLRNWRSLRWRKHLSSHDHYEIDVDAQTGLLVSFDASQNPPLITVLRLIDRQKGHDHEAA